MKSIEELARELVTVLDSQNNRLGILPHAYLLPEFTALKSALERPVEKQWPKYFKGQCDIIRFENESDPGVWQDGIKSFVWTYSIVITNSHFTPIPAADALAIIEKAKQNDQPAK